MPGLAMAQGLPGRLLGLRELLPRLQVTGEPPLGSADWPPEGSRESPESHVSAPAPHGERYDICELCFFCRVCVCVCVCVCSVSLLADQGRKNSCTGNAVVIYIYIYIYMYMCVHIYIYTHINIYLCV